MAEARRDRRRSALSDITPNPGPGSIPSIRELESLSRCDIAIEALFGSPRSEFSQFDRNDVARHTRRDVLAEVVRWYWYNDMEDRRTKGSDLKRELAKVVTHLASLKGAMAAVAPETRHALNRLLKPPTQEQPERQDIFGEAERLNNLILERSRPLVALKFTKQASTSVVNACERLASIWRRSRSNPSSATRSLEISRGAVSWLPTTSSLRTRECTSFTFCFKRLIPTSPTRRCARA